MKKLFLFLSTSIAFGFWGVSSFAQSACTSTSGSSSGQECLMDVKSFKLKVYEFALCTDFATVADRSMCATLFTNADGFDLTLSKNATLPLGGDTTIAEGTYTHAYILVNKTTHLKSVFEFSTNRMDLAGNSGKFCYSNGTVRTEDSSGNQTNKVVTCGSSDASQENQEIIKFDSSDSYSNSAIEDPEDGGANSAGYTKLYALKTRTPAVAGTSWATDTAILASQNITDVTIGPTTSGLNIAFTVTNGIALNFLQGQSRMDKVGGNGDLCGAANSAYCVVDVGWLGMNFLVTAN